MKETKETNPEKDIPKTQENNYELTEPQKSELIELIKNEDKPINWENLGVVNPEDLEHFLFACKNFLFKTEEYKKQIVEQGNINIIMKLSNELNLLKQQPKPETYFILFKAVFDLFKSGLKREFIISYTEKIILFIQKHENKDKIILLFFNDLFEVLIYLKINQINDEKMQKAYENLDNILKSSLNSEEIKKDKKYLNSIFKLVNIKINTQQYVIFSLLLDYIITIININSNDSLKLIIFHGLLKPLFKLQMDKNTDVSTRATECYKDIINKKIDNNENFQEYYKQNVILMNEIFEIAIKESYPPKINENAWNLVEIFLERLWLMMISKINDKKNSKKLLKKSSNSAYKNYKMMNKFRSTSAKSYNDNNNNLLVCKSEDFIYIPFYLFPEVIDIIIKSYEFDNKKITIEKIIINYIIDIIRLVNKTNEIKEKIKQKILDGLKNEKIKDKEKLVSWLELLLDVYNNDNYYEFFKFINEFIEAIPFEDVNAFKEFVELLLKKGLKKDINKINSKDNAKILGKLINKIIISKDIVSNKNIYESIVNSLKEFNDNIILTILEIMANAIVFKPDNNKNNSQKDDKDKKDENDKKNENNKKNEKNDNNINTNILIFYEKMVCELTDLLFNNNNLTQLRESFLTLSKEYSDSLFTKLYSFWSIDPISVLILCIGTERFELAFNIILNFKEVEFNDDMLKKLGRLVEYFKKNNYEYFCQKLLAPSKNIFFIKTLFGILMILPQGVAFDFLNEKLSNVQTLILVEDEINEEEMIKKIKKNEIEINNKIKIFLNFQKNQKAKKVEEAKI